ncbi:hypothetical protein ACJMK2_029964 [Sinanodonta woodiana]|uniref:LRAT domain-containing protein n=1 Tax=Sinanodonta woodiana TaxID=1069815 RepID=A0ABD3XFG5_SINWO
MPRRSCLHCCLKIRVENMNMLKMGQHIIFPGARGLKHITKKGTQKKWYKHHAIIKEVKRRSDVSADLVLIHFWSTTGNTKFGVTETTYSYNLSTDEIYILKYKQARYSPSQVVQRADSKQGNETKYNILTYNCEHLATWCVVGEKESMQVNNCKSIVRQLVIFIIVCALWILKMFHMEGVYKITEFVLLPFSIWYFCYRRNYFIQKYKREKTICKACLNLHLLDLWTRFVTTYIILIILKFYFHYTYDITSFALFYYLVICNIIKLIRKKLINSYPDEERPVKNISNIEIGDVISLNYEGSNYYIIVTCLVSETGTHNTQTRGKLSGIFYDSPCLFSSGTIMKQCFNLDLTMHNVTKVDYTQFETHTSDMVAARAQQRIGEKKWDWFSNRSLEFCHWAKFREYKEDTEDGYSAPIESQIETVASSDICPNVRSSLLIEKVEAKIREDIYKGDIVEIISFGSFTDSGIVVNIVNGTQDQIFTMDVVLKKGFIRSVVKMVRFNVDLRVNRIWIHRYHPVHCYSREKCIERARKKIDEACKQWTQTRFIRDCIIRPWKPQKQD